MELLVTIAYYFFVRLIFIDYKLLPFNLFWKMTVCTLYVCAALTEVLMLGQYTPYSKFAFVQSYVVQMAPEYGGRVDEVYIVANQPIKKGDPLFKMDTQEWQDKLDGYEAQLVIAANEVATLKAQVAQAKARVEQTTAALALNKEKLAELSEAKKVNAVSTIRIQQEEQNVKDAAAQLAVDQAALIAAEVAYAPMSDGNHAQVAEIQAKVETAKYNLEHTIIRAPSDGYVPNMQLYPGSFIRIKQPVMSFVNTDEYWVVGNFDQRGMQHVQPGDKAEIAFEMYPGRVFQAKVKSIAWASSSAQGIPSGTLPQQGSLHPTMEFAIRLDVIDPDPEYPIRFGASALVAVHTNGTADALIFLRQIEIRSESYLNYLFNPF